MTELLAALRVAEQWMPVHPIDAIAKSDVKRVRDAIAKASPAAQSDKETT